MLRGFWYDANFDKDLQDQRNAAEEIYFKYNQTTTAMTAERQKLLTELLGKLGKDVVILTPFYVDYGYHTFIDDNTFINHNAYLMDPGPIHIGKFVFIGPNFGAYTSTHPLIPSERNRGFEKCDPITIEDNVWIGGDVTILPGVTVGEGCVIGAGSVVTRSLPPKSLAFGNPCRVRRVITPDDSIQSIMAEQAKAQV